MDSRIKGAFLILVLVQGLHSVEEYYGRLWEELLPAAIASNFVSSNPRTGSIILNIALFVFGLLCWSLPVRKNFSIARGVVWLWIFY